MKLVNGTEWLFYNLWIQNPFSKLPPEKFNIPKTIIYKWGSPHTYYWTEGGRIKRSFKDKIDITHIEGLLGVQNIADNSICVMKLTPDNLRKRTSETIQIQHLKKSQVSDELGNNEECRLLQQLIIPKENHNRSILK